MVAQNTWRTGGGKSFFLNNFKLVTVVDQNKCLKQIKLKILLHACAPIFELLFICYKYHGEYTELTSLYEKIYCVSRK